MFKDGNLTDMKILVNGANGKLGKEIINILLEKGQFGGAVDKNPEGVFEYPVFSSLRDFDGEADMIIDASHHSGTKELVDYAVEKKLPLVIATTGQTEEEYQMIEDASKKIPLFNSANMSLGIAALIKAAKTVAQFFPDADIEIVEAHHNKKVDAPSGTALLIGNELIKDIRPDSKLVCGRSGYGKREKNEIGISAVRMGAVVGEHTVYICTDAQTITLTHSAHNRRMLAEGTVMAAEFLFGKPIGRYNMNDLTKE